MFFVFHLLLLTLFQPGNLPPKFIAALFFLLDVCFIQGLSSWITIGKGRVEQGLYHLQTSPYSPATHANVLSSFFDKNSLFWLLF